MDVSSLFILHSYTKKTPFKNKLGLQHGYHYPNGQLEGLELLLLPPAPVHSSFQAFQIFQPQTFSSFLGAQVGPATLGPATLGQATLS